MCNDVTLVLAASLWDLPKISVCPGVLPQLGDVPVVLHKLQLTWMHEQQTLLRPELMAGRYIPKKFSVRKKLQSKQNNLKYGIDIYFI